MKPYLIGLYEKSMPSNLTFEEKMLVAKESCYDYIEMSIDETDEKLARLNMSKAQRLDLVKKMYLTDMPIRSICLSGHRKFPLGSPDPFIRKKGMEIMEKTIELADDLGVRTIQLAGYDVYYEKSSFETEKIFSANLKAAVEMAASKGILLGFETMETEFMNTVEKAMKYVSEINSPYLYVYPDSGNITNASITYNRSVLEDLNTGNGHIIALHLKESRIGIFREIPFGEGHVPFDSIIKTAWKLGIRRYVAEFWYTGNPDWKTEIKDNYNYLKSFLDEAAGIA